VDIIDSVLSSSDYPSDTNVILCGDFNDLHKFKRKISCLTRLKCHVHQPTRLNNSLDLIFSNYKTSAHATILPPIGRSDHSVVYWKPSDVAKPFYCKKSVRKFTKGGAAWFRDAVISTDWLSMVESEVVLDESASILLTTLKFLYDTAFPVRTVRIRDTDPVWLTPSLRLLMNERDQAWNSGKLVKFRRLREEVSCEIRRSKCRLMKEASSSNNPKTLWRCVKKIGRYCSNKSSQGGMTPQQFNDFFSSVYVASKVVATEPPHSNPVLPDVNIVVTEHEVENLFSRLRKKSPGPDGLPFWIFRDLGFCLAPSITNIFNRSLREGHVPLCFKEALLTPVPKTANSANVSEFRPVSLLPILSKVLEKLVARYWILPYIKHMDCSQYAYIPRTGSGPVTALTMINHKVLNYLDGSSGAVRLMALDFSKAFDILPHDSILASCVQCGLPSQAIVWIKSYLSDRVQRTKFNDRFSTWFVPSSGVPQGSILGPLLFCIATSSLKPVCRNTSLIKYADDLTFLHFIRESTDDNLQIEFDNVVSWSDRVGLQLNFKKCSITNIITKKSLQCPTIFQPSGKEMCIKKDVKILGLTFSHDLKWNCHVETIVEKVSKRIFVLRTLKRSGCDSSLMFCVYRALIRSVMMYAYPCFCNASTYLHEALYKVERRAFRIVFNDSIHEDDLKKACDKMCRNLFQVIHDTESHPLRFLFQSRVPTSRNSCTLRPPHSKTKRLSRSFVKYCK
jgi:hypothetical protein